MFLDKWRIEEAELINNDKELLVTVSRRIFWPLRLFITTKQKQFRGSLGYWKEYPTGFDVFDHSCIRALDMMWRMIRQNNEWEVNKASKVRKVKRS